MDTTAFLKSFVEGSTPPEELIAALTKDEGVSAFFEQRPPPLFAKSCATAFEYLLGVNTRNPNQVHDARKHVALLLGKEGVTTVLDDSALQSSKKLHGLYPSWVDVPADVLTGFVEAAGKRSEKDLKAFVKERIAERYRCLKKPPSWLQGSNWPHDAEGNPLVFVGQLDLGELMHDTGAVYVFIDPKTRAVRSVVQTT